MKIVIYGLAKSGTTALFYKLKNSLPPDAVCLFEPQSFDPRALKPKGIKALVARGREPDVLAKVLPFRPSAPADADSFAHFDRHVLLIRDPRDRLISRLLYGVYHADFCGRDDKVTEFLALLRRKEDDPRSVSVKRLLAAFAELNGERFTFAEWAASHTEHSVRRPLEFHDRRGWLFLFRYEEMIDGRFAALEEYLGVSLKGDIAVPPELDRVRRTQSYGNWRDWLTEEDVECLRPVLQPFLDRYYSEADWELNPSPTIAPAHGSLYVARIVSDRRAALKL
ncbi:MAG TPA: hypothetical protein VF754_01610, partial [Pyrinomonadaceae bacterium]